MYYKYAEQLHHWESCWDDALAKGFGGGSKERALLKASSEDGERMACVA